MSHCVVTKYILRKLAATVRMLRHNNRNDAHIDTKQNIENKMKIKETIERIFFHKSCFVYLIKCERKYERFTRTSLRRKEFDNR